MTNMDPSPNTHEYRHVIFEKHGDLVATYLRRQTSLVCSAARIFIVHPATSRESFEYEEDLFWFNLATNGGVVFL